MEKKYQVFVSSTYEDLREERQQVMQALLELDCIPSGMELFPAANEDQWSLIKEVINECDYYIVILGGRYGSTDAAGVSFTEKEYRFALETNKPVIGFLHRDVGELPQNKCEKTEAGKQKLLNFRELVSSKMCKFWGTPEELGSVVSRSLINLQRKHPSVGWIRGDVTTDKEAGAQILKLNRQIEDLQARLQLAMTQAPPGTDRLAKGEDEFRIRYSFSVPAKAGFSSYSVKDAVDVSWNEIFYQVSPLLIHEADDDQLRGKLNEFITSTQRAKVIKRKDLVDNENIDERSARNFSLEDDDFQTIKVQLRALGLIAKSVKNRSVKDTGAYWTLTPYGDHLMNRLRAIEVVYRADVATETDIT